MSLSNLIYMESITICSTSLKKKIVCLHDLSLENTFSCVITILLNSLLNIDNLCNTLKNIEGLFSAF